MNCSKIVLIMTINGSSVGLRSNIKDLETPPDHAPKAPPPFEHTGWLMT